MREAGGRRTGLVGWWADRMSGRRTRWITVLVWLALAVGLTALWPSAAQMENPNPPSLPASASSMVAARLQLQAFGGGHTAPGLLVFYRRHGLTPANLAAIARFDRALQARPLPRQLKVAPLSVADLAAEAHQHRTTVVVPLAFRSTAASSTLGHILSQATHRLGQQFGYNLLAAPTSGARLAARLTGPIGIAIDAAGLFSGANVTLLAATTMLVLVLLVLIYRSPLLPLVPLIGVGFAYTATSAVLGEMARAGWLVLDAETVAIMTVLMFGAGTDYALLVVARYREQLAHEPNHLQALGQALRQAAGPVAMSAGTVMLAVTTLLLARYGPDHRFAIPFAMAVGMTALASLTLVPACLALLGRRAFYPRAPKVGAAPPRTASRAARLVTGHPARTAAVVGVVLLALAALAPSIRTTYNLLAALPASSQARQGYNLVAKAYGAGASAPVAVLATGSGRSHLGAALAAAPGVAQVSAAAHGAGAVTAYQVTLTANPLSNRAIGLLPAIASRARAALAHSGGGRVLLAGETAQNANAAQLVTHDTRVVMPLVLVSIFLLLFAYLRSLVAAAYLVGTVVLSYFAALGLGYLVLHSLLHVGAWSGGVALYAFVFLVALGEDYTISLWCPPSGTRRSPIRWAKPSPSASAPPARSSWPRA